MGYKGKIMTAIRGKVINPFEGFEVTDKKGNDLLNPALDRFEGKKVKITIEEE